MGCFGQLGLQRENFFFLSAFPTAQNSPKLNIRFTDSRFLYSMICDTISGFAPHPSNTEFALPELPQIHGGFQNHSNLILAHKSNFGQINTNLSRFANFKVHIFWEGHKILWNLHRRFDRYYIGQIYSGDFAKFCGLLRIYEL